MSPNVFYRVVDSQSQSKDVTRSGLRAGNIKKDITFNTLRRYESKKFARELRKHLDWSNRDATVFISVYDDKDRALEEVERRLRRGCQEVKMMVIDIDGFGGTMQFRNLRRLAEKHGVWIEDHAFRNSEHEWVFLKQIRRGAILGTKHFY